MPPAFVIENVENTGPTDNSGDDSLWVVSLSESGRPAESFRFCVLRREGVPNAQELSGMIDSQASGFANAVSALDQFRAREVPHPENSDWRRVVWLSRERASSLAPS